ncbi:MAG: hypothetical protein JJ895_13555 [Balneolaceae bacterium]|nr:hypothetical protein [Balneolaceae bacterium]
MALLTAEVLLIAFSAITLIIIILVAWQFRNIKSIISGIRTNQSERNELISEVDFEYSEKKSDNILIRELEELKAELKNKTIELAKIARENDAKADVLESIKMLIVQIQKNPNSTARNSKEILAKINSVTEKGEDSFNIQIDELNKRFYASLKQEFPELTTNDLRMCAYIKIGMSAKEIAELLHIKPSSVYISRSRLRKKLGLLPTDDLHGFLALK